MSIKQLLNSPAARSSALGILLLAIFTVSVYVAVVCNWGPAGFVQGVATLLAVLVALFGASLRKWIARPKLNVDYVHGPDYCEQAILRRTSSTGAVSANCMYLRLRVANDGTRRAEIVEVLANNLYRQAATGGYELVRRYSLNLKWTNLGLPRLEGLSPKMERFCDIGHVIDPANRGLFADENEDDPSVGADQTVASLDLEARPNSLTHLLQPGRYRLSLAIAAANHEPIRKTLEIDLLGPWHSDLSSMLSEGIRVRLF